MKFDFAALALRPEWSEFWISEEVEAMRAESVAACCEYAPGTTTSEHVAYHAGRLAAMRDLERLPALALKRTTIASGVAVLGNGGVETDKTWRARLARAWHAWKAA